MYRHVFELQRKIQRHTRYIIIIIIIIIINNYKKKKKKNFIYPLFTR